MGIGDLSETTNVAGMYVVNVAYTAHPRYHEIVAVFGVIRSTVNGIVRGDDAETFALLVNVVVYQEV